MLICHWYFERSRRTHASMQLVYIKYLFRHISCGVIPTRYSWNLSDHCKDTKSGRKTHIKRREKFIKESGNDYKNFNHWEATFTISRTFPLYLLNSTSFPLASCKLNCRIRDFKYNNFEKKPKYLKVLFFIFQLHPFKKNQNTFSKVSHINYAMFDKKERMSERNEWRVED